MNRVDPASAGSLADVRAMIDELDAQVVELLWERALCTRRAADFKGGIDVRDPAREAEVVQRWRVHAAELGADPDLAEKLYRAIVAVYVEDERDRVGARRNP